MSDAMDATPIRHEPAAGRFVLEGEPEAAVLEYALEGGRMTIHRTFVPPSQRGGGVAGRLARAALEHAREAGLRVRPECSYLEVFFQRHPEWADVRE